jgi:hypothetical protein
MAYNLQCMMGITNLFQIHLNKHQISARSEFFFEHSMFLEGRGGDIFKDKKHSFRQKAYSIKEVNICIHQGRI